MAVRIIPHEGPRIETGPTQFGDDWPGLFIRGDNALGMAIQLRGALRRLEQSHGDERDILSRLAIHSLRGLIADLESCRVSPPSTEGE